MDAVPNFQNQTKVQFCSTVNSFSPQDANPIGRRRRRPSREMRSHLDSRRRNSFLRQIEAKVHEGERKTREERAHEGTENRFTPRMFVFDFSHFGLFTHITKQPFFYPLPYSRTYPSFRLACLPAWLPATHPLLYSLSKTNERSRWRRLEEFLTSCPVGSTPQLKESGRWRCVAPRRPASEPQPESKQTHQSQAWR